MSDLFTSDTHYSHQNIIRYANRPFADIDDMREAMIANWNAVVRPEDRVFHLGDFAFCDPKEACCILDRLNGQKFLVFGNHDKKLRKNQEFLRRWQWAKDFAEIDVQDPDTGEKRKVVLCHYAMRVWNQSHRGSWHLYGHSHGTIPDDPHSLSMDVGVDPCGYTPVSLRDIKKVMSRKIFIPVDRHGTDRRE